MDQLGHDFSDLHDFSPGGFATLLPATICAAPKENTCTDNLDRV
jgi:hypothetical protein